MKRVLIVLGLKPNEIEEIAKIEGIEYNKNTNCMEFDYIPFNGDKDIKELAKKYHWHLFANNNIAKTFSYLQAEEFFKDQHRFKNGKKVFKINGRIFYFRSWTKFVSNGFISRKDIEISII